MNQPILPILIIMVGIALLFFAFTRGFIGGAGAGSSREKNPFGFWLGIAVTIIAILAAAIVLVSKLV